jgi:hypothetical protein
MMLPAEQSVLAEQPVKFGDELSRWLNGEGSKTVGGLIEVFGKKSFAILFVLLLGVPALPLPTGGATHVFEVIAALLAVELLAGRERIWLRRSRVSTRCRRWAWCCSRWA